MRKARWSGVPNAMQGFSQNRDQPIQIEAASLEMRDKKKEATFSGQCEGGAGRHHHDGEIAVCVLRFRTGGRSASAGHCEGREVRACADAGASPGPGAVRQSASSKRAVASS